MHHPLQYQQGGGVGPHPGHAGHASRAASLMREANSISNSNNLKINPLMDDPYRRSRSMHQPVNNYAQPHMQAHHGSIGSQSPVNIAMNELYNDDCRSDASYSRSEGDARFSDASGHSSAFSNASMASAKSETFHIRSTLQAADEKHKRRRRKKKRTFGQSCLCTADHLDIYYVSRARVSAGNNFTVITLANKKVYVWGDNSSKQLTDQVEARTQPEPCLLNAPRMTCVAAGYSHAAGVTKKGRLYAWGDNSHKQCLPEGKVTPVPSRVVGVDQKVATVTAGIDFTVALSVVGDVFVAGNNAYGQLGLGQSVHMSPTFASLPYVEDIISVVAGSYHCVAVTEHEAFCWGHNGGGACTGNEPVVYTPKQIRVPLAADDQLAGCSAKEHTVVWTDNGMLYSWGKGDGGRLGNRSDNSERQVYPVDCDLVSKASCGGTWTSAVSMTGALFVFGSSTSLALGGGKLKRCLQPKVIFTDSVIDVSCGWSHSCVILQSGLVTLFGWGSKLPIFVELSSNGSVIGKIDDDDDDSDS